MNTSKARVKDILKRFQSNVIFHPSHQKLLLGLLPSLPVSMALIYQGSTHGWQPHNFHKLCDGRGHVIALMRSKAGKVFGGYTAKGWDSVSKWKED